MTALSGPLLTLVDDLDRRFTALADRWRPTHVRFEPTVSAAFLDRMDYFRSFPHLFTAAVSLADDDATLESFVAGEPVVDGVLRLGALAPVTRVLSPAACYPLYDHRAGARISGREHHTMAATCFRREAEYVDWERQASFTMREVVCIGSAQDVADFLAEARMAVDELTAALRIPVEWQLASDPFFRPSRNPQYLMQQIDPTKHEVVYDGRLAIASANLHHDHFGRIFDIATTSSDSSETPAHTACLAFGVERWVAAIVQQHGPDPGGWPVVAP
ncbi:MAG TPA: aminoacyl--tRNA ligase-related protein [Mycobacteriales bacterium]|nr:aminoacyl--tRNA ligase-related protein [Mycobacteriales bacterium]